MTVKDVKKFMITNFESKAWMLLERIADKMDEKNIFIDYICGCGLVKDEHDGKNVHLNTVYRHNGTSENVNVEIRVDEWKNGKYTLYYKTKIHASASDKVIENRLNKIIEVLNEQECDLNK